jgi:hypothetical protein
MERKNKNNVFTEIGFGNKTIFSTEFERRKVEYRNPRLILPKLIKGIYVRMRFFGKEYILSTYDGFKIKKDKKGFKFLIGLEGLK